MKHCFQVISALLIASLLSACAYDVAKPSANATLAPAAMARTSPADDAILAIQTFQNMTPAALFAARESARETFERDPAVFRRVRYMLALFVSPPTAADDDRLLALLEPLLLSGEMRQSTDGTIATFVQHSVAARKKLREELVLQRSRANNTAAGNASRREDRDAEIRTLRTKVDDLERQLAAMKSIERSVTRR